jgi:hypothetical protein
VSALYITKSDGEHEPFDISKLVGSLKRAGAPTPVAESVAHDIERDIWPGISTREIYARAFSLLREHKKVVASRYSLKRSLMEFGPSGFPFEIYIAELFRAEGFTAEVGQIIQGACVEHEVDVVIHKKEEMVYAEAKFHNTVGFKTDLKTVLYIQARIFDIREAFKHQHPQSKTIISGLVVTNTKFTDKAVQYAQCQGLALLGWDHPGGMSLHDKIREHALYPVTTLTTLSTREKMALLSKKVVLCAAVPNAGRALAEVGIVGKRADEVFEEVGALCVPGKDIL